MRVRNVAIVHYNTPELTEAAIMSVKKHGGLDYKYYVFDNSDKRPFDKKMHGVTVFDNTKGQILDFDKELAKYPEKDEKYGCAPGCWFGSDKHMMSVQKLWDLVPEGFLLMDSDILLKRNVDHMFMEHECTAGYIRPCAGPWHISRLLPMLLWINVPMCKAGGAVFFDPNRSWALHKGWGDKRNFWDTGAAFLDDIRHLKPACHGVVIDIRNMMEHYGSGSWKNNTIEQQQKWLNQHRHLWYMSPSAKPAPKYTVLTYIFDGYENVHEVVEPDDDAEYILVTDDKNLKSETWDVRYDASLDGLSPFDKCYEVRFHPFRYAHTDTVVRVDGSMEIRKPLRPIVDAFWNGGYDRCLMIHPFRNTMPAEYDAWVNGRGYPREQADKCLALMRHMGYDLDTKGLFQGCFEIVRKNHVNYLINDMTFDMLRLLGNDGKIQRVSQTVWSFVINHMFNDRLKVMPVSDRLVTDGKLITSYRHKSMEAIPESTGQIEPIMFGKPVETWELKQ